MKFGTVLAAAAALAGEVRGSEDYLRSARWGGDSVDRLQMASYPKLAYYLLKNRPSNGCNLLKADKRREWSSLSKSERKDFIRATQCLMTKPAITPPEVAPGAKSRYDDFVAVHIQQTLSIHVTANFLSWHRYYIHEYEKALRNDCGYKGSLPYWNWNNYADDLYHSALFDGSDDSLGGDGSKVDYPGVPIPGAPPPYDIIPAANGGGCIQSGPFKDFKVNLGPVAPVIPGLPSNPRPDGLGYNPRCIRRDLNPASAAVTKANYTYDLIVNSPDIATFQTVMQGEFNLGNWGVHAGGHFTVGGDPGGDFFASPGDPGFWLHHGMIDRVWWNWQLQDLEARTKAVAGTLTMFNDPPSPEGTLQDPVDLGAIAGAYPLGELLDTMDGPFCYIYI